MLTVKTIHWDYMRGWINLVFWRANARDYALIVSRVHNFAAGVDFRGDTFIAVSSEGRAIDIFAVAKE